MSRRARKPGILAVAHRERRRAVGPRIPYSIAVATCRGREPNYQTGPRAGQELADACVEFLYTKINHLRRHEVCKESEYVSHT